MLKGALVKTVTKDGLELQGFWSDQKSDIAVFHTHGTAGDFYTHQFIETEGERLSSAGISFLTANNRGHDVYADIRKHVDSKVEWASVGGGFEKFEDCVLDIDSWVEFLLKNGIKKIILQGHSLCQKAMYYQHIKHHPNVIGQILISPQNDAGYMYYKLGEKKYKEINRKIKHMVKSGKGSEKLPPELCLISAVTSAQMYFGYLTEEGTGNLTPYHNPESPNWHVLEKTKSPLLVVFGGSDVYMKPSVKTAAKLMKEKAKSAKSISVKIIPGAPHSYIGFEAKLAKIITDWINLYNFRIRN